MKDGRCMEYRNPIQDNNMSEFSANQIDFRHDHQPLLKHDFDFKDPVDAGHYISDVGYIVHTPSPPPPPPPPPSIICYCSSCCSTSRRNLSPRNRISITSCSSSSPSQALKDRWSNSLYVTSGCCRCRHSDYTASLNKNSHHNACCNRRTTTLNSHHPPQYQRLYAERPSYYLNEEKVCYEDQVTEEGGDRVVWEFKQVTLNRVPGYGFGIAVSGGKDNPHFANGDPSITVSDVLRGGPAEKKLLVNDRITSVNGISLENVEYGEAVQVLRDSGSRVVLSIRRRLLMPSTEPRVLRVQLNKKCRKDDFGIQLANLIYIKELSNPKLETVSGGSALQEGDVILKINSQSLENLTLKEVKKLIENSKEKLQLTVQRNTQLWPHPTNGNTKESKDINYIDSLNANLYGTTRQNLYVQPPTRQYNTLECEKSNLIPRNLQTSDAKSNSPPPLLPSFYSSEDNFSTITRQRLDQNNSSLCNHFQNHHSLKDSSEPIRPPLPRPEDYYDFSTSIQQPSHIYKPTSAIEDPRFIAFQKGDTLGVRLIGGNTCGIFVNAVQPGSAADLQGLKPADKILKANDVDMTELTREEAILYLTNVRKQLTLIVQNRQDDYENVLASRHGDSFHIKAHFDHDQPSKGEMNFCKGDVFHVVDTMYNDELGSWLVYRIGRNNQEVQKGVIPNKEKAEQITTAQFNAAKKETTSAETRGGFFKRKRTQARRSKSLSKDHWDDVVFGKALSKFPAYERVVLKHPGFIRPVVLFGPVSDIARKRLLKDFPEKFSAPQLENPLEGVSKKTNSIIKLSAIRTIMDRNEHALLDITPNAVDRLNYAQFYPIVILLRADSKHIIKELRNNEIPKTSHRSSRKLFDQCQKLEKEWSRVFTSSVSLSTSDSWYRELNELINKYQSCSMWVSETQPEESLNDDFLFPMSTIRPSYVSSPDSDQEQENDLPDSSNSQHSTLGLSKYSSDPNIVIQNDPASLKNDLPPYSATYSGKIRGRKSTIPSNRDQFQDEVQHLPTKQFPPPYPTHNQPFDQKSSLQVAEASPCRSSLERHHTISHPNLRITNFCDDWSHNSSSPSQFSINQNNLVKYSAENRITHDPYRFTRSTQQPIQDAIQTQAKPIIYSGHEISSEKNNLALHISHPPKISRSYKPEPPPKPKIFSQGYYTSANKFNEEDNLYQHAKSFSIEDPSNNYRAQPPDGTPSSVSSKYSMENSDLNGFDSGHGSSLDCSSTFDRRSLYSPSLPFPKSHGEINSLHSNFINEERISAFQIYKKPKDCKNAFDMNNGHHTIR